MSQKLIEANDSIPYFTLEGQTYQGKVVRVVDGDTCNIILEINNGLLKFRCRLNGIDTPEIKPRKTDPNREQKIKAGLAAKSRFSSLCENCILSVECDKFDKYGRLLVTLKNKECCINQVLLDENHARPYNGGTKLG